MGWSPAPGVSQGEHESILYGSEGSGSNRSRALEPVLDPAARWSSESVPEIDTAAAASTLALVVDDLVLSKQEERRRRRAAQRSSSSVAALLDGDQDACARYAEEGLEAHPEKICDFVAEQDVLVYKIERNVLRARNARFDRLRGWVRDLERRQWARPRGVD